MLEAKTSRQKALEINLDVDYYGVFAEIGAGQEVARHFFQAGAASQTIAKTICAYDMAYSDHIYGQEKSGRYVCQSRLEKMLKREYEQINKRLHESRPETNFFAFADTVSIRNFAGSNNPHGWMGVRFQMTPDSEPSDVIVHVKMFDNSSVQQQDALGAVGVNVIYSSFYKREDPVEFVKSLRENVSRSRIEIDMVKVSGPAFDHLDSRLIDMELVKQGMTDAIFFNEKGNVVSISDALYRKNILLARGSYRPITKVNMDLLKTSLNAFCANSDLEKKNVLCMAEITLSNLGNDGSINNKDFIARLDLLKTMGFRVLISNYPQYYKLSEFLSQFKCPNVGLVLGIYNFTQIFDVEYNDARGGLLESLGLLFQNGTKVFVYPSIDDDENLQNLESIVIPKRYMHLYKHFVQSGQIEDIKDYDKSILHIYSRKVLNMLRNNEEGWEDYLPKKAADAIRGSKMFIKNV